MRAKVELAEAEKNMKAAENDYLIAKLLLTSVMGVDESQIENPTDSLVYLGRNISNPLAKISDTLIILIL